MKILLIEDETESAKNLVWLTRKIEPQAQIAGILESVEAGIDWLTAQPQPDLIISDIQLADGNTFDIFKNIKPQCPVIFTTAYDAYAIKSFEVNSIDYLLKPISEAALQKAFDKYKSLKKNDLSDKFTNFIQQFSQTPKTYRQSFLVRFREKLLPVKTESFSFFYIKDGLVYGKTLDNNTYLIEEKLEDLDTQLSPTQFFRANRQYIVSRDAITEIDFYFNGRLSLKTKPSSSENILISKERVPVFRKWFEAV
jgi:two-component system LytT family response regulator